MADQTPTLLARLCEAETPRELPNWHKSDGYYVEACRVSKDDVPALVDVVRYWLDPDWLAAADKAFADLAEPALLPVTAWRTLADLKDEAAVEPLIAILTELGDEFDDWAFEELPHVFGKLGPAAIEPLAGIANDSARPEYMRSIAARGLRQVASYHPATRDEIVPRLTAMMADAANRPVEFNSALVVELVELQAVEAAEAIERAFAADRIDVGMIGDWERVRKELGVEGLGLPMPKNPHNSLGFLTDLRSKRDLWDEPATVPVPRRTEHVGRNEPCPCGSGRKFKKCCGNRANQG
jgi:hypothetical protein